MRLLNWLKVGKTVDNKLKSEGKPRIPTTQDFGAVSHSTPPASTNSFLRNPHVFNMLEIAEVVD
jgi:hypothetical protein